MKEQEFNDKQHALRRVIRQLSRLVTGLVLLVLVLLSYILSVGPSGSTFNIFTKKPVETSNAQPEVKPAGETFWTAPDFATVETHPDKEKIKYGRELIAHTAAYFGPEGKVNKHATNGMNCQNCHLDAGTKVFGNNYGSVFSTYPRYRPRSGSVENIYKRINDCFERSLNGQPLDTTSAEMLAMAAYINWLGKDVPKGEKAKGSGLKDIAFLDRAADPAKGKIAYMAKCITCHMADGAGQLNADKTAYTYPPLWGPQSYNIGAGLYRISSFAKYVRYNMPLGATHANTLLSDEEAWDIAAFVNSQTRPEKSLKKDWPKIEEKPFDHPFGPYVDGFDEKQHKYGPFQPIKDKQEKMKKKS